MKRELERVTEERDRARDEGKRAEQLRQQLEVELKVRVLACLYMHVRVRMHLCVLHR